MRITSGRYVVRLAETEEDVAAAQGLRYAVFVDELGATPSPEDASLRRERDRFDPFCRHLLLIDTTAPCDGPTATTDGPVVGVYRLLHGSDALRGPGAPGFYTAGEYDLSPIEAWEGETLELGRSCVGAGYRGSAAMQLLWMGMSQYIEEHDVSLMFGVASFHGADVEPLREPLAFLHHHHMAPPELRPRAVEPHYVGMDLMAKEAIDRTRALRALPALIKGYLRVGGSVGDGAYIDHDFNTVDVCLVMDTDRIKSRYKTFYGRRAPADLARVLG